MSRIYFDSPSGGAELRGSERAHMGLLCSDLTVGVFGAGHSFARDVLPHITHFKTEEYQGFGSALNFQRDFELMLSVPSGKSFHVDGESFDVFSVCLNTALAIGNDAVKLCARLHGQCEIHAWIDGPSRKWMESIIYRGLRQGVLRKNQGWEEVSAFLVERDDESVVTSYSVCDRFPSAASSGWTDEHDGDDFYDLSTAEQWAYAFKAHRPTGPGPEIDPAKWSFPEYFFTHGETALSLLEKADEMERRAHPERFSSIHAPFPTLAGT